MVKDAADQRALYLVNHVLDNMKYGEVISHKRIAKLISEEAKTMTYYMIVSNAKTQLIPYGKTIVSVLGVGYKVLEPDGYNEHAYDMFAKGVKYIHKAKDIAAFAPKDLMSEDSQKLHEEVLLKTHSYASLIREKAEEFRKIINPAEEEKDDE
jgi:hypothetical protein